MEGRVEAFYGCPTQCYTSSAHVWVRMTFPPLYRLQEMLFILLLSAEVFCCRCWAVSGSDIPLKNSVRSWETLLNFKPVFNFIKKIYWWGGFPCAHKCRPKWGKRSSCVWANRSIVFMAKKCVLYKVMLYIIWPWLHRCLPSPWL